MERFWRTLPDRKAVVREYLACGFTTVYSCISWKELRATLPDMAEVMGHSIIARHRLRA